MSCACEQVLLALMQAVRNLAFDCPSNREKAGAAGVCTGLTAVLVARGDTPKLSRTPSAQDDGAAVVAKEAPDGVGCGNGGGSASEAAGDHGKEIKKGTEETGGKDQAGGTAEEKTKEEKERLD